MPAYAVGYSLYQGTAALRARLALQQGGTAPLLSMAVSAYNDMPLVVPN